MCGRCGEIHTQGCGEIQTLEHVKRQGFHAPNSSEDCENTASAANSAWRTACKELTTCVQQVMNSANVTLGANCASLPSLRP